MDDRLHDARIASRRDPWVAQYVQSGMVGVSLIGHEFGASGMQSRSLIAGCGWRKYGGAAGK